MAKGRLLLVLLAAPLLLGSGSRAMQAHSARPVDDSIERYVHDLSIDDRSDRLYAARVLRARLRIVVREAERARPGSVREDEALAALDDFEVLVAPACIEALGVENVAPHCADILGLLEHAPAEAPLAALLAPEAQGSGRLRRHAAQALERIRAALPLPAPATP